jgi:hypothetical protein
MTCTLHGRRVSLIILIIPFLFNGHDPSPFSHFLPFSSSCRKETRETIVLLLPEKKRVRELFRLPSPPSARCSNIRRHLYRLGFFTYQRGRWFLSFLLLIYLLYINLTIFGLRVVSDGLAQWTETGYKFVHWKVEPQCLQRSLLLRMSILPQQLPTPNDTQLLQWRQSTWSVQEHGLEG